MTLPFNKSGTLVFRTICKPLANLLESQAARHSRLRHSQLRHITSLAQGDFMEEDWQLQVRCLPFGPRLAFTMDATMRPKKEDILHGYNVALLETPSPERLDLRRLLDTPIRSMLAPSRVFFRDFSDDEEVVWREIHRKDSITSDMEELCLSDRTPPTSGESFDDHYKILASIHAYLIKKPNIWRVLLFGSFLRDPSTARDIDIGFESGEHQDPSKVVEWADDLKDLIGKEVDLVDLSSSFMDNMLFIRRSGRYITLAGTLFEDSIFLENFEVLGRCIYAMQTLREQALLHLQVPDCDSFGIAMRLQMFYKQWENFALRWLKISSLAIPVGKSYHMELVNLFIPHMDEGVAGTVDDLRKFRDFSGKGYVDRYDLVLLHQKATHLLDIINWAEKLLLSYRPEFQKGK